MSTVLVDFASCDSRRSGASTSSARSARRQVGLRLTTRGRVVLGLLLLVLAMAAVALVGGPADSSGTTHHPSSQTVVVQPGQTLWDIAEDVAPEQTTRDVVAALTELNNLPDGGGLRAGQPLVVPTF